MRPVCIDLTFLRILTHHPPESIRFITLIQSHAFTMAFIVDRDGGRFGSGQPRYVFVRQRDIDSNTDNKNRFGQVGRQKGRHEYALVLHGYESG